MLALILVAVASIALLAKSSDWLVESISRYSRELGISEYLIGFLLLSVATAIPELVVSIIGAVTGDAGLVLGTVLGSNLFKIPLIGGLIIAARRIKVNTADIGTAPVLTLLFALLPLLLLADGILSRADGGLLLLAFALYLVRLWNAECTLGNLKKDVKIQRIWKHAALFVAALLVLLASSRILVAVSGNIAATLAVPSFLIGLVALGSAGSAPEFFVQARAMFRRNQNMALGNMLGSIVANSTMVLGIAALVHPLEYPAFAVLPSFAFITAGTLLTVWLVEKETATWKYGLAMLAVYAAGLGLQAVWS